MKKPLTFEPEQATTGELLISLTVPGRLPSWNKILGMEQWARYRFKKDLATTFLSALRAGENDFSTKTTSVKSITSIYAATLESCLETRLARRKLRSARKRSARRSRSAFKSTCTASTDFVGGKT